MGYYAKLPMTLSRQNVSFVNWREFKSMVPRRGLTSFTPINHWTGSYFNVTKQGKIIVKTSLASVPFMDEFYLESPLIEEAASQIKKDSELISEVSKQAGQSVTETYMGALIDNLNFAMLSKTLPKENLVEQSAFVVWRNGLIQGKDLRVVLVQPFIFGINFGWMFDRTVVHFGIDRIQSRFEHYLPFIGPQMRKFLEHADIIDFFPQNFMLTPDLRLLYLDYQPITNKENADINANAMNKLVSSWGY